MRIILIMSSAHRTRETGDDMAEAAAQQSDPARTQHRATAPGVTIPRLTFAEQLVLWCARRLAADGHEAATTEGEASDKRRSVRTRVGAELGVALRPTGGPDAGAAAAGALARTLTTFDCAGVRSLRLNPLCSRFVSNDERLFLSFLAACQEGDCAHASALLSWFLPPAAMRLAATDGAAFAAALRGAGFRLPQRLLLPADAGTPLAQAADVPQTVH